MYEFGRACNMDTLYRAWQKVSSKGSASFGVDGVDLALYRSDLTKNLRSLQTSVLSGNYRPCSEKVFGHKNREICVSCVDEKIVQTALSEVICSVYSPPEWVHGFIAKRSVFTAKKSLDRAVTSGTADFLKVDIRKFYDSMDVSRLLGMVYSLIDDDRFFALLKLVLTSHGEGLSTGSCLSPALSNLYLYGFDCAVGDNSEFYARYVDDMLIAPTTNRSLVEKQLDEVGLCVNPDKTFEVSVREGFRYLGFDIKADVDAALQNRDFALADKLYQAQTCDLSAAPEPTPAAPKPSRQEAAEPEFPAHILHVRKKCHIIRSIIDKAKTERFLGYPDKTTLLQVFHCLGADGARYIHYVLSSCDDYDYATTERHIKRYNAANPLGCKKLTERFGDNSKCVCNFKAEKMFPSPIIHAKRVKPDCFTPQTPQENIGHFKAQSPKRRVDDALASLLELNKKKYEIEEQQSVFKGQIESLFERGGANEFRTPQGLLIKNDDGIFIKVG